MLAMDALEALVVLIGFVLLTLVPVGLVMGIVGFARAGRALEEVARLRRELAALRAAQAPPAPALQAMPWAPVPVAEVPSAAEAEAEPPSEDAPEPASEPARPANVEEVLALKWGVWLGAVALLFAGVFLVRYAVEHGVLGPAGRCVLAAVLGAALIGGAEWLRRQGERQGGAGQSRIPWPDQAPPALASGGVAVLFGAAYGFGPYYDLLPASLAFLLMAAVGFVGLGLSLRFGQLVAAVGLAGAYVTPLLVATEHPSIPGLYIYLLVVTAAALAVVRYAAWVWLDWASLAASTLWVLVGMTVGPADAWVPGLFMPAVALVNLALLPRAALDFPIGRQLVWIPFAALGVVGLALYLAQPGWGTRVGVLLLAPLAIGKGVMEKRLDRLPWLSVLFFLLALLGWALPYWRPTGEIIGTQEYVQAVLPGGWAPEVIQPLLITAACMTALYVVAGLWRERVAEQPLAWSALAAAVPTLTLGVTYTMVERFQARPLWAVTAAVLAAGQTLAVEAARRSGQPFALQRAGVHAAGAVASLALGLSMVLADQWLTVTVALLLPPLAWIAERAELPGLRKVALAVALLVLTRLLLNWYVFDYGFGHWPIVNGLLVTYGLPAVCFAYASTLFRRRGDDLLVAVLESGAVAFLTILVALEIRHWASGGNFHGGRISGVLEAGLHVSSMAILALMSLRGAERLGRKVLDMAWRIQGGLALACGFLLLLANPLWSGARIDGPIVFNPLLFAYLLPAGLAGLGLAHDSVRRRAGPARWLGCYALVTVFAWITLEIRHDFHPGRMGLYARRVMDAELWSWSAAWLVYGISLMGAGIHWRLRPLRLAALTVVGLTAAKVFLIDMSGLSGLWRAVSFLGLGLTLIGLGAVFRRFVGGAERPAPP